MNLACLDQSISGSAAHHQRRCVSQLVSPALISVVVLIRLLRAVSKPLPPASAASASVLADSGAVELTELPAAAAAALDAPAHADATAGGSAAKPGCAVAERFRVGSCRLIRCVRLQRSHAAHGGRHSAAAACSNWMSASLLLSSRLFHRRLSMCSIQCCRSRFRLSEQFVHLFFFILVTRVSIVRQKANCVSG